MKDYRLKSDCSTKAMNFSEPKGIDPLYFPEDLFSSSFVTIFEIYTKGMEYNKFWDDPVFPAMHRQDQSYYNNATVPGFLGCVDNVLICDPDLDQCWNWPKNGAKFTLSLADPIFDEFDGAVSNADLAHVLLSSAIYNSFEGMSSALGGNDLEAKSHCDGFFCYNLPQEQWKAEARYWFETSLAQMQYRVLDIVRGTDEKSIYARASNSQKWATSLDIPSNLRGICHMGKFKSVGWRNVSVWGLVGLLSLAGAISLASVTTEDGELWLIVGARLLYRVLRWGMRSLRTMPWESTLKRMSHFVSTFPRCLVRVTRRRWWL